jgi:hypothetical protein
LDDANWSTPGAGANTNADANNRANYYQENQQGTTLHLALAPICFGLFQWLPIYQLGFQDKIRFREKRC